MTALRPSAVASVTRGEEKSCPQMPGRSAPTCTGPPTPLPCQPDSGSGLAAVERMRGRLLPVEVAVSCAVFESRSNLKPFNYSQLWYFFFPHLEVKSFHARAVILNSPCTYYSHLGCFQTCQGVHAKLRPSESESLGGGHGYEEVRCAARAMNRWARLLIDSV